MLSLSLSVCHTHLCERERERERGGGEQWQSMRRVRCHKELNHFFKTPRNRFKAVPFYLNTFICLLSEWQLSKPVFNRLIITIFCVFVANFYLALGERKTTCTHTHTHFKMAKKSFCIVQSEQIGCKVVNRPATLFILRFFSPLQLI